MIRRLLVIVLIAGNALSGFGASKFKSLGQDLQPLLPQSPAQPNQDSWYPDKLAVIVSNRMVGFVPHPSSYKFGIDRRTVTLRVGGMLTLTDPMIYKNIDFRIVRITTKSVTLARRGSMDQRQVPLEVLEDLAAPRAPVRAAAAPAPAFNVPAAKLPANTPAAVAPSAPAKDTAGTRPIQQ